MKTHRKCSYLILLAFILTMVIFPIPAYSQSTFADIQGHWAQGTIEEMGKAGIIAGYPDGSFKPEGKISRAQFATLMVKGFGYTGSGKTFADTEQHWAKDYIAIASANNIVKGYSENSFGPDDQITREQMAVMIVRAAQLQPSDATPAFKDAAKISDWARTAVNTAYANGIIKGLPDGQFDPQGYATRAQSAVVIQAALNAGETDFTNISKPGTYGPLSGTATVEGSVTVRARGVILQNLLIQGDLIIAEEVGDGDVTLNNVTVKGKTYVRGGGKDSIHINGGQYSEIIIEKTATGQVRIVAVDASGLKVSISENAKGEEIILNGDFKSVTVNADDVNIITQANTNIEEFRVQSGLKDVNIELDKDSTVEEMVLDSQVNVEGEGSIDKASGKKVNESSFATNPDSIIRPGTGGGGGGGIVVEAATLTPVGSIGIHGNKVYEGYKLMAGEEQIDLVAGNIESMTVLEPGANKAKTLTVGDDTDPLLWFNVQKASGAYKFTVKTKIGKVYEATMEWTAPAEVDAVATENEGDHDGNYYVEYTLGDLDLTGFTKMYQIKPDGNAFELTANTDSNLWFKTNNQVEGEHVFLVKKDGTWYTATINYKAPEPEVTFTFNGLDDVTAGTVGFSITTKVTDNKAIANDTPLRYKAVVTKDGSALADQVIKYPEATGIGWPNQYHTFTTDGNGTAYFGPETGFTLADLPALLEAEGVTTPFQADFEAGSYSVTVSLLDISDEGEVELGIGTKTFSVAEATP